MPGKALAIMLLAYAAVVTVLVLVLISMEGHMIAQWGRGQSTEASPSPAYER